MTSRTPLRTWLYDRWLLAMQRMGLPVGERTESLMLGLRWNGLAAVVSRVLCGVATLGAARWLGPAGFGQANLALAATFWVQVPLFLGLPTAIMHYIPQSKAEERGAWAAAGLQLLGFTTLLTLTIGFAGTSVWARWHGVPPNTFRLALLWCAGFAAFNTATALLSGLERFSERAKCEMAFAVLYPAILGCIWISGRLSPAFYVLAFAIAYGLAGFLGLFKAWRRSSAPVSLNRPYQKLLNYGMLASLGSVASALFNAPGRLIINRYLPLSEVGVLSAYQGGSIQMALFLLVPATQVFFPIASRTPDRKALFKKINRLMLFTSPLLILFFAALLTTYLVVLGKHYPLRAGDVLVFSGTAVLSAFHGLLSWFLASQGRHGLIVSVVIGLVAGGVNLIACQLLIPSGGMVGAAYAYALGSLTGILLCYLPVAHPPRTES